MAPSVPDEDPLSDGFLTGSDRSWIVATLIITIVLLRSIEVQEKVPGRNSFQTFLVVRKVRAVVDIFFLTVVVLRSRSEQRFHSIVAA